MLIPITYSSLTLMAIYVIGMNLTLQTVSTMFVDFTNWVQDYIRKQVVSQTGRIPGVH